MNDEPVTDTPEDWDRWHAEFVALKVDEWRRWLRRNIKDLTGPEAEAVEGIIDDAERLGDSGAVSVIRKYVLIALRFRRPEYGQPKPDAPAEIADDGAGDQPAPATLNPDDDPHSEEG